MATHAKPFKVHRSHFEEFTFWLIELIEAVAFG